jgi:hypothetical protein
MRFVLDSLHEEAAKRDIRICALGTCALEIAEELWLEPDGPVSAGRPVIFTSAPVRGDDGSKHDRGLIQ